MPATEPAMLMQFVCFGPLFRGQNGVDFRFRAFMLDNRIGHYLSLLISQRTYLCLVKLSIRGRSLELFVHFIHLCVQRLTGRSRAFENGFDLSLLGVSEVQSASHVLDHLGTREMLARHSIATLLRMYAREGVANGKYVQANHQRRNNAKV